MRQQIKCLSCFVYEQIGLAYIFGKACPHKTPRKGYPTLVIWLVSLSFISYGIATQFYESRLDRFEHRRVLLSAMLTTDAISQSFPELVTLQKYKLPHEPRWYMPFEGIYTLTSENKKPLSEKTVRKIATTIVNFKHKLGCSEDEWRNEKWKCVNLSGADLIGADLTFADLRRVKLVEANLKGAKLEKADLRYSDLKNINLEGSNLKDTKLQYAELHYANLSGTNLTRAKFNNSDLIHADLSGANLGGSNLEGADLAWDNLEGVFFIDNNFIESHPEDTTEKNVKEMACRELKKAKNWEKSLRCHELSCGATMVTPQCITDIQKNRVSQEVFNHILDVDFYKSSYSG
ncbi:MAG: pentapeptide repeat-containing protein [Gammaproteobacteria bacterium]